MKRKSVFFFRLVAVWEGCSFCLCGGLRMMPGARIRIRAFMICDRVGVSQNHITACLKQHLIVEFRAFR